MMDSETIERIRIRAADPETRTDALPPAGTSHLGGRYETVVVALDGGQPEPTPLPAPVDRDEMARLEAELGLELPEDLVLLLTRVADGGFGPGAGLASIREMAGRYRGSLDESPDRHGRPWPPHLFPIGLEPPGLDCLDLETGGVIYWDEEIAWERPGHDQWAEAFRLVAESLEAWLQKWLASPPPRESTATAMDDHLLDGVRRSLEYWRSMAPSERAEFGLPEVGWEQDLFGHLGIDLDQL